ncbi:MAG: hypothetical protein CM15mP103_00700 [Gammaproteobacteria bacterium]|nr:MAG: hypothetical protein CM15mP103_00700 [Gammaproteobacteria bacterium]
MLKSRDIEEPDEEHYSDTAILCIASSTYPPTSTHSMNLVCRLVSSLHRMAYGSAGFYGGDLSVVRQFGLAIYFSGSHAAGSPVLRAASCAWLLSRCSEIAEKQERLSFTPAWRSVSVNSGAAMTKISTLASYPGNAG